MPENQTHVSLIKACRKILEIYEYNRKVWKAGNHTSRALDAGWLHQHQQGHHVTEKAEVAKFDAQMAKLDANGKT